MAGRYNNDYIYGSEAPARRYEEPERIPRRQRELTKEEKRQIQIQQQTEERIRKAGRFGALHTLFITAAAAIVLFTCTGYIGDINEQAANAKQIKTLQEQFADIKETNDQTQLTIDTSIDYAYIYKVAVEELGMVNITSDKVINYQSAESEYVIQYSDVTK